MKVPQENCFVLCRAKQRVTIQASLPIGRKFIGVQECIHDVSMMYFVAAGVCGKIRQWRLFDVEQSFFADEIGADGCVFSVGYWLSDTKAGCRHICCCRHVSGEELCDGE